MTEVGMNDEQAEMDAICDAANQAYVDSAPSEILRAVRQAELECHRAYVRVLRANPNETRNPYEHPEVAELWRNARDLRHFAALAGEEDVQQ